MFALQPELKIFSGSANRDLARTHLQIRRCATGPGDNQLVSRRRDLRKNRGKHSGARRFHHSADLPAHQPASDGVAHHGGRGTARQRGPDHCGDSVFGYARQDRKDQPRVPITAKLVANLLYASGVNRVLTMDLHAQQVQGFFDIPVDHLYSLPVLIKYLRKELKGKTTVVSPDLGGLKMASAYAEALHANLAIVAKERRSATETEASYLIGEVEGRDVLLVDDLTETAGTLTSAAELLKKRGAQKIYAGVSHAVLVDIAIERLQKSQNCGISNDQQHACARRERF